MLTSALLKILIIATPMHNVTILQAAMNVIVYWDTVAVVTVVKVWYGITIYYVTILQAGVNYSAQLLLAHRALYVTIKHARFTCWRKFQIMLAFYSRRVPSKSD